MYLHTKELTDEEKQKILKEFDDAVNDHLEIVQKYAAVCDEEY